jgi:Rrf2 family protein
MFSQTVEYALRAIVCLAQNEGLPLTTQQISVRTSVPGNYLSKVLQSLGRSGLISATRGIGGGHLLSVPPAELSVLRVVSAIEPIQRIKHCPLGLDVHGTHLCPLHARLDHVLAEAESALRKTTIAELLGNSTRTAGLCETPAATKTN